MSAPSAGGASRDGYGSALLQMIDDDDVVVLEADLGKSTKSCLFLLYMPFCRGSTDTDDSNNNEDDNVHDHDHLARAPPRSRINLEHPYRGVSVSESRPGIRSDSVPGFGVWR